MNDPDYCDHGKDIGEPCFFCRRLASAPRAMASTPEHRNPPESGAGRRTAIFTGKGGRGGAATAAKKARLRGETEWSEL